MPATSTPTPAAPAFVKVTDCFKYLSYVFSLYLKFRVLRDRMLIIR